jgi:hypothetical protein
MLAPRSSYLPMLGAFLLLSLTLPLPAQGQVCFRGHPRDRCDGFTVLEFTAGARLSSQTSALGLWYGNKSPVYVSWAVGYLHNLGPQSALGAALKVAADDDGHRYGAVLRYRQWLGPTWSLDLEPGVLLGGQTSFTTLRFPSATADIGINWGDRVSFIMGVDQLRRGTGTGWDGHAGIRFGTWLAPIGLLGLIVLAGATYN